MKGTEFTIKQKIIAVLFPALLIVFNLFLFGPFTIYSGNFGEFAISLASSLKSFLVPSLVMVVIMTAIGSFLPEKLRGYYVSLLLVAGVLLWLQGNIFLWNYGVLGNKDIDWTKDTWRGWVDGTTRSEEHTSELQSRLHLVCRLLLEKKKRKTHSRHAASATRTSPLSPPAAAPP